MAFTLLRMTAPLAAAILLSSALARAQWLKYKTPDIPRLADGKANLAADAPRMPDGKPDLSGVWERPPKSFKELRDLAANFKPAMHLTCSQLIH